MNSPSFFSRSIALICLVALGGCRDRTPPATPLKPPAPTPQTAVGVIVPAAPVPVMVVPLPAARGWAEIKDYPYDRRSEFIASAAGLAGAADAQFAELNSRRGSLPETSAQDWDVAMREFTSARAYLRSKLNELGTASSANWSQMRDSIGEAWKDVQEAGDRVRRSTTMR